MQQKKVEPTERKPRGAPRGRPFAPGQSGNPAGKPRLTPERLAARRALEEAMRRALAAGGDSAAEFVNQMRERVPEALGILDRAAGGEELPASQLEAMRIIFERAFGRPQQSIELHTPEGPAVLVVGMDALRLAARRVLDRPAIDHDDSITLKRRDLLGDGSSPERG